MTKRDKYLLIGFMFWVVALVFALAARGQGFQMYAIGTEAQLNTITCGAATDGFLVSSTNASLIDDCTFASGTGTKNSICACDGAGTWVALDSYLTAPDNNYIAVSNGTDFDATGLLYDDGNNVGIGTSSPSQQLHVYASSGAINALIEAASGNAGVRVKNAENEWNHQVMNATGAWRLRDTTNSKTPFEVEANSPDNTLYLDSTGNVGIGTSSPSANLELGDSSSTTETFRVEAGTTPWKSEIKLRSGATDTAEFSSSGTTGEVRIGGIAASYFTTIFAGNAERVRVTTAGDVGIGKTPTAGTELDINGDIEYDDPAWTAMTLENSWVDYGGGYRAASYRITPDGTVQLRGLVKDGSSATATIETLPAGYRPTQQEIFAVMSNGSGSCRVDVATSGAISPVSGCSTTWLSLSGISFAVN